VQAEVEIGESVGYFSNGSEGDIYQEAYCDRCVNWRDEGDGRGEGCPIIDIHLCYCGEQLKNETIRHILNALIPRGESDNKECRCFYPHRLGLFLDNRLDQDETWTTDVF
jgi:hypothetical protein